MQKIASTTELQNELRQLLKYARSNKPSRAKLANQLAGLSRRVAGYSYGVDTVSVVFTEGRKVRPFNVDTIREINNTWIPVVSLEGDQTEGNLKLVNYDYGHSTLTNHEERMGLRREIQVDVQYPVGPDEQQSEKTALNALIVLGKRLGFSVRPSQRGYYPQTVQTQWRARPPRVSPFFR